MGGGYFYPDPQPVQPVRRVLPQTQGDQPPRSSPRAAQPADTTLGTWAAMQAVPAPVQKALNVAPLTLVYGDRPPGARPSAPWTAEQWRSSWMPPAEPMFVPPTVVVSAPPGVRPGMVTWSEDWRLDWRAQAPGPVAPLTLTYGQQPPAVAPNVPVYVREAWRADWPAQSKGPVAPWASIAYGAELRVRPTVQHWLEDFRPKWSVPPRPPLVQGDLYVVGDDWGSMAALDPVWWPDWVPPKRPPQIAALLSARGDQVTRQPPTFAADPIAWSSPSPARIAPLIPVVAPTVDTVLRRVTAVPWITPEWPIQAHVVVAPLTLTYGDSPRPLMRPPRIWAAPEWAAQMRGPIAALLATPVIPVFPTALAVPMAALVPWWAEGWRPPRPVQNAAWVKSIDNPPFPGTSVPRAALLDWWAEGARPPRPVTIAAVLHVRGDQPPPRYPPWYVNGTLISWIPWVPLPYRPVQLTQPLVGPFVVLNIAISLVHPLDIGFSFAHPLDVAISMKPQED